MMPFRIFSKTEKGKFDEPKSFIVIHYDEDGYYLAASMDDNGELFRIGCRDMIELYTFSNIEHLGVMR